MKLRTWSLMKLIALAGWINVFLWLWAVAIFPTLHDGGWDWKLMLFFVIAVLATLGSTE